MKLRQSATSYVPAVAPVTAQEPKPEPTQAGVSAQVAGNAAGGIGMVAIVVACWLIAWGALHGAGVVTEAWPDPLRVTISATVAGMLTFGVLMFVRNSLDEIFDTNDRLSMTKYIEELETAVTMRDQTIVEERRLRKIAESQAAVFTARAGQRTARRIDPEPTLGKEWEDAQQLILRHYNGTKWGRDALVSSGWTPAQWDAAMTVLSRAGVAVKSGRAWVPWDKNATVTQALAAFQAQRQLTIDTMAGRFGRQSDEANTHGEARSDDEWGRGGEG